MRLVEKNRKSVITTKRNKIKLKSEIKIIAKFYVAKLSSQKLAVTKSPARDSEQALELIISEKHSPCRISHGSKPKERKSCVEPSCDMDPSTSLIDSLPWKFNTAKQYISFGTLQR